MTLLDRLPQSDPLGLALIGALVIHALLILGVSFDIHRGPTNPPDRTIDVTMVKPPVEKQKAEDPQYLAQSSQQGSGNLGSAGTVLLLCCRLRGFLTSWLIVAI